MEKVYLEIEVEEGDIIRYEMPPFCSGEYLALVKKDQKGVYIGKGYDFFAGCRDYEIIKVGSEYYDTFRSQTENWVG